MIEARVVELFAGVGGFRVGLEKAGWRVVWSNQWEPSTSTQHASDCYVRHFGEIGHSNVDISEVLDEFEDGGTEIPDHELLVGGFPCQDYSVAKVLAQAKGLRGNKGVLWWEIERLLRRKRPPMILLENVDRLLKSPANQRGRDFAVMLASLNDLGYVAEWRVVNAADYGFPQRRRRVFIVGYHEQAFRAVGDSVIWITKEGALARALPVKLPPAQIDDSLADLTLRGDLAAITRRFGMNGGKSPFLNSGIARNRSVWTRSLDPDHEGPKRVLGDVLIADDDVAEDFFISDGQLRKWMELKGAKKQVRKHRTGFTYNYNEGPVAFPDASERPSRTILTGEGGTSPSRFKHVVRAADGRLRRLTPVELERLNGFEDGWTEGMSDTKRAFMMGNALVVGVVERIGRELLDLYKSQTTHKESLLS